MMKSEVATIGANAGQYAFVALQTDWIFQWVQLGLAIACSLVLLAYRLWKWYKEAKADGKITKEEIKEGLDIVSNGVDEIKDKLDNKKED